MNARPMFALAFVATVGMLLSGCSVSGGANVDASLSVYDAKKIAQQTESEMAALIPASSVDHIEQRSKGVLMSCSAKNTYHWAGGTSVYLRDGADSAKAISSIYDGFSDRARFQARQSQDALGDPQTEVVGPDDSSYIAGLLDHGTTALITSFSPCFHLADDLSPLDNF